MKTRNLLCVSVVCLLASSAWAGDKNMAMERRVKVERALRLCIADGVPRVGRLGAREKVTH